MILSVLDQAPICEGSTGGQALRNTLDLAVHADRLGYRRYWLAEHHATPMLACASPEVMIGPIAAATSRIRVGSGGVMLPHYSPFKVAENFSMLAGMFPGRIDLGLGRAPGSDQRTAYALQRDRRDRAPDDFIQQLLELMAYLDDRMPDDHPFRALGSTLPGAGEKPDIWLLGSSEQSGIWAGELGLPYMFADFINPRGAAIAYLYRQRFETGRVSEPTTSVCVSCICAETDEAANVLSSSARMVFHQFQRGRFIPVPPVETAQRFLDETLGSADAIPSGRRFIFGSPKTVRQKIEEAAAEYGANEVMLVTIVHDHDARKRSYALIAEEFGLDAA